jgi:uncharacterized protein YgiM (DUF1202 family)
VKSLLLLAILLGLSGVAHAVQNAKIVGDTVEIYAAADFDSEIIDEVRKGESYKISNKPSGPFYRIKLKSGKVGYIVDYELDIEGRGPMREKDLDEMELKEAMAVKPPKDLDANTEAEEQQVFGRTYQGPVLLMYNYHEDTMGGEQIDELVAIGYRSIKTLSWSVAGTTQVPKYYTKAAGNSATGVQLWADVGFSNEIGQFPGSALRFSGNVFSHLSLIDLKTPVDNYNMQDMTAGVNLEFAFLKNFRNFSLDVSVKYYFDKSNYAALGLACLF